MSDLRVEPIFMRVTIAILSLFLVSLPAGQADQELPHVSTYGTAVMTVQPDMLHWRLSVSRKGADVSKVAEAHAEDVAAVLKFLLKQEIAASDTQTSYMRLGENSEYRNDSWVKEGFRASTDVAFVLKHPERYPNLWVGLSKIPGVSIDATIWDSSRRIELQNRARLDAVAAAREKASDMAAVLAVRIHEPLAIEEVPTSNGGSQSIREVGNRLTPVSSESEESAGPAAPGAIKITARVWVSFRIAPE
jgi:uncharacterized protein YggE